MTHKKSWVKISTADARAMCARGVATASQDIVPLPCGQGEGPCYMAIGRRENVYLYNDNVLIQTADALSAGTMKVLDAYGDSSRVGELRRQYASDARARAHMMDSKGNPLIYSEREDIMQAGRLALLDLRHEWTKNNNIMLFCTDLILYAEYSAPRAQVRYITVARAVCSAVRGYIHAMRRHGTGAIDAFGDVLRGTSRDIAQIDVVYNDMIDYITQDAGTRAISIARARADGWQVQSIAKQYNIHRNSVSYALKKCAESARTYITQSYK